VSNGSLIGKGKNSRHVENHGRLKVDKAMKYIEHLDTYSNRDKPLSFHWKPLDDTWQDNLGLPPARSDKERHARDAILTEAAIVGRAEPDKWISYSRARDFYAGKKRYHGPAYAYRTVPPIIDALAAEGLLEHDKKRPGNRGWQSRFRATPALLATIEKPLPVIYEPLETVRLKDRGGKLINYRRDTAKTKAMRWFLAEQNEALAATVITLKAPGAVHDGNVIRCGEHTLYPAMQTLWRVFNRGKFTLGGRFYGGWWQQARKDDRAFLEINGGAVVEPDYEQLHPRMLYAQAGKPLAGDAYTLDDWERPLAKKAFNILINANTPEAAVRAVTQEIGGQGARKKAEQLIADIKRRHQPIAQYFHSGVGLRLQRIDSDMAGQVLKTGLSQGFVLLPIHDSFVTLARHEGTVREAMDAAFRFAFPRLVSPGYEDLYLHMAGVVGFVLPLPAQGELFPSSASVPFHEVSSWGGGFLPPGIREGIIHEMKRRNLRQIDVASRIGLSRPQLTNALRGRFGVGTKAAAALKAFVLEEAVPA